MTLVTIPDSWRASLRILVKYDVTLLCYMPQLYFVCNNLILVNLMILNIFQCLCTDLVQFQLITLQHNYHYWSFSKF